MQAAVMDYQVWLFIATTLVSLSNGQNEDPGPQTFSPRPPQQHRYKEVVMYLTKSQLRNIQENPQGLIIPKESIPKELYLQGQDLEKQTEQQDPENRIRQNHYFISQKEFEELKDRPQAPLYTLNTQSFFRPEQIRQHPKDLKFDNIPRPEAIQNYLLTNQQNIEKQSQNQNSFTFEDAEPALKAAFGNILKQESDQRFQIADHNIEQRQEQIQYEFPKVEQDHLQKAADEENLHLTLENILKHQGSQRYQFTDPNIEKQRLNSNRYIFEDQVDQSHQLNAAHKGINQKIIENIQTQEAGQKYQNLAYNIQQEPGSRFTFKDADQGNLQKIEKERIRLFYPQPHIENIEIQRDPLLNKKYNLIPYEYAPHSQIQKTIEQQIIHFLESQIEDGNQTNSQHIINTGKNFGLRPPTPNAQTYYYHEQISEQSLKDSNEEASLQYAPKYISDKYKIANHARLLQSIQSEKLKAHAIADSIAKSPPVIVQKDITITKKRPLHIIKNVHIPVPAPYLVPVPQPYRVKVPQPYAVPLEIIRPYPVEVLKTEKIEVEKPVPIEVEKHVEIPVEKKVYVKVEKPYPVEHIVPVELKKEIAVEVPLYKPKAVSIIRHIWEH